MSQAAFALAFELHPDELTGAARTRALAAAAAIGAVEVVLPPQKNASAGMGEGLVAARAAATRVTITAVGMALDGGCPNDAAIVAESASRAAAMAAHGADVLELAGFGFPDGDPDAPPAARFLGALCRCAGCLRRLAARGLDGAKLLAKAAGLAGAATRAAATGTALARPEEIGPWLVQQLGARESAALLATRKEALAAMVQAIRKRLPTGAVLRARAHPSPFVGGMRLGGGLLALSDWLDGFTLDAPAPAPGADAPDPATLAAAVKSARSAALPESRFAVRIAAPKAAAAPALTPLARAARKEGAVALRLVSDGRCAAPDLAAWQAALADLRDR